MTAFKSVVLDVDSTVAAIEGIDWLAALRDPATAGRVLALTNDAMEGRVPLDAVYAQRLAIIQPTRDELAELSGAYIASAMPGVREAVAVWQDAGVRVVLVSGGLRDALLSLGAWLGIAASDVHAVEVEYDATGLVSGVEAQSLLSQRGGKPMVVSAMDLPRPTLAVGDGATDAELISVVDRFIAFTGVVRRDGVVALAATEVASFAALTPLVLGH